MGELLAKVAAASKPKRAECSVAILLSSLSDEHRADLRSAMAAPKSVYSHAGIARAVSEVCSVRIAANTIARHRERDCKCQEI